MAAYDPNRPDSEKTIGELAKAEVSEKVSTLARGGAVGIAAGVFAFLALILLMHSFALGLASLLGWGAWAGYLIEGVLFILIAAGAGWFAYNSFEKTGAPIPTEAIEEAQKTKAMLTPGDDR